MKNKYCYQDQKWTEEMNQYLLDNKMMNRNELYILFNERYPGFTFTAFCNQRSRIGAVAKHQKHDSTKILPLYSEDRKKGYTRIKVGMPSIWWPKGKWVWVETHPELLDTLYETDSFYFLDGDNNNFAPENIERVRRREQCVFVQFGGVVKGNPELTKLHIAQARMKLAMLDAGEKTGDVVQTKSGRRSKKATNAKSREYNKKRWAEDPEGMREKQNRYRKNASPEAKAKHRKYQHEWYLKQKELKKNGVQK